MPLGGLLLKEVVVAREELVVFVHCLVEEELLSLKHLIRSLYRLLVLERASEYGRIYYLKGFFLRLGEAWGDLWRDLELLLGRDVLKQTLEIRVELDLPSSFKSSRLRFRRCAKGRHKRPALDIIRDETWR